MKRSAVLAEEEAFAVLIIHHQSIAHLCYCTAHDPLRGLKCTGAPRDCYKRFVLTLAETFIMALPLL